MIGRLLFCSFAAMLLPAVSAAELPFPVGEELIYSIAWNGIPVAWSRAVTETDRYEDREVLALRLSTRTYPFFDRVFKVDDVHETLVDPETFLPIRYTKNLQEGRYRCHEVTTFDFETLEASYVHQGSKKEKKYAIRPGLRDILSFLYFMRGEDLEENTEAAYSVMSDEKIYDLTVKTLETGPVSLPRYDRPVPSLEIRPEAMFDGLFVQKGKGTVWVSRDPRRLLVRARLRVPFGRVTVTLQEVNGPGSDFWITEKKDGDDNSER